MGFDLYGLQPPAVKGDTPQDESPGHYFRNNIWWWRPLWEYTSLTCSDILTDEDIDNGHSNSGHKISKSKAVKMRNRIDNLDEKGYIKLEVDRHQKEIDDAPMDDCPYCNGTGERDFDGELGKCNACDGVGRVKPFWVNYPFTRENVMEFRNFLDQCGGFQIC